MYRIPKMANSIEDITGSGATSMLKIQAIKTIRLHIDGSAVMKERYHFRTKCPTQTYISLFILRGKNYQVIPQRL